jgi:hypothetical protein
MKYFAPFCILALSLGSLAGCGTGAYEERLNKTVIELRKQHTEKLRQEAASQPPGAPAPAATAAPAAQPPQPAAQPPQPAAQPPQPAAQPPQGAGLALPALAPGAQAP